ncbi:hypothetical protein ECA2859 [Pectobacterium atrosepticum SCRI1043]|uniref:Uncharacterized protein n=1 Tax=Pectobacterium atrosepticum (strain SCRI 1043 / ATCC BAA-672) TaxID=218491 RepID=Q6D385_PECAS|nr:hypothetical protein ECA2859 [Pectobacterium atrosepticum SCRI1043]
MVFLLRLTFLLLPISFLYRHRSILSIEPIELICYTAISPHYKIDIPF